MVGAPNGWAWRWPPGGGAFTRVEGSEELPVLRPLRLLDLAAGSGGRVSGDATTQIQEHDK